MPHTLGQQSRWSTVLLNLLGWGKQIFSESEEMREDKLPYCIKIKCVCHAYLTIRRVVEV